MRPITTVAHTVERLVAPLAAAQGLEVVEVAVKGSGPRSRVQVVVDKKGGVSVDDCRGLSRALSRQLDADDPIDARYVLEVTSPGTARPLTDRRSFDRVAGRDVLVTLTDDPAGQQLRATVVRADADTVLVTTADGERAIRYDAIARAVQALPW